MSKPKNDYTNFNKLITKVEIVDPKAAKSLKGIKYLSESKKREIGFHHGTANLSTSFVWGNTKQGHKYWEDIYELTHPWEVR